MKKWLIGLLAAAAVFVLLPATASAVSLTPKQQVELLAGYSDAIRANYEHQAYNSTYRYWYTESTYPVQYTYFDLDQDGYSEILFCYGNTFYVYGLKNGKVQMLGTISAETMSTNYNRTRLACNGTIDGSKRIFTEIRLSSGKISTKRVVEQIIDNQPEFIELDWQMTSHFVFPANLNALQQKYADQIQKIVTPSSGRLTYPPGQRRE